MSLALADLLVSLLCLPSAATAFLLPEWIGPEIMCPVLVVAQKIAHGASILSLTLLAIDRFLSVRRPKLAPKLSSYRWLFVFMLWLIALISAIPVGFVTSTHQAPEIAIGATICCEQWSLKNLRIAYYCFLSFFIHILPCFIVVFCHIAVSSSLRNQKLDSTKMRQKPKQIIIMAPDNIPTETVPKVMEVASSDDDSTQTNQKNRLQVPTITKSHMPKPTTRSPTRPRKIRSPTSSISPNQPSKDIKTIIRAHRRLRAPKLERGTSLFSVHQGHSLAKRKRLGNLLILLSVIFTICWLPYVVALIAWGLYPSPKTYIILLFCLLLGHTYSAVSPIIYWIMNKSVIISLQNLCSNTVKWPSIIETLSCSPCMKPSCLSNGGPMAWAANSSTNEENLGAFHPKYVRPHHIKPQTSRCTSQYFH